MVWLVWEELSKTQDFVDFSSFVNSTCGGCRLYSVLGCFRSWIGWCVDAEGESDCLCFLRRTIVLGIPSIRQRRRCIMIRVSITGGVGWSEIVQTLFRGVWLASRSSVSTSGSGVYLSGCLFYLEVGADYYGLCCGFTYDIGWLWLYLDCCL